MIEQGQLNASSPAALVASHESLPLPAGFFARRCQED